MANNPKCWVHCLDCGEREMMRRSAAFRRNVRCRACGGPLEVSDAAYADLRTSEYRRDVPIERARVNLL